jgi:putative flippase GtrA
MITKLKNLFVKYRQIIAYLIVGGLTTVVSIIARYAFWGLFDSSRMGVVGGQVCAVIFAFFMNKHVVFQSKTTTKGGFLREAWTFFAARAVSFVIDFGMNEIFIERYAEYFSKVFGFDKLSYTGGLFEIGLVDKLIGSPEKLTAFVFVLITQVVIIIANYLFSKLVVFKKPKD